MATISSPAVQGPPTRGAWFDGQALFLNEVFGEEVADCNDPRLTESEQQALKENEWLAISSEASGSPDLGFRQDVGSRVWDP